MVPTVYRGILTALVLLFAISSSALAEGAAKRGEYLAIAADCLGCHTALDDPGAVPLAGGGVIKTPFGTFYGPNITSDKTHGIGSWSEDDFIRAMRYGTRPDGAAYFPAFPYPSFTMITDSDLRDLWAYLRTVPPNAAPNKKHDLGIFGWRFPLKFWKWMFFKPHLFEADAKASAQINRGAYLVRTLGHCGECHTPRNLIGVPRQDRYLAGGKGPDGKKVPDLSPTHLRKWTNEDIKDCMTTGVLPDGDLVGEAMGTVVKFSLSKITDSDLDAIIAYLRSLPPMPRLQSK